MRRKKKKNLYVIRYNLKGKMYRSAKPLTKIQGLRELREMKEINKIEGTKKTLGMTKLRLTLFLKLKKKKR